MKVYLITDDDIAKLRLRLLVDPKKEVERQRCDTDDQAIVFQNVHRFYNYHVCCWLDEIQRAKQS